MTDSHPTPEPGEFSDELVELVSASLDGELTAAEEEHLADLLSQDPKLHAYRERMRRMKRLVAGSAPLMAGAPGSKRPDALEALQNRLATLPAEAAPSLSWQLKLGIAACFAGLLLVTWQVIAFSRRVSDGSSTPQPSQISETPAETPPEQPPLQPDVPEEPEDTTPEDPPQPPEQPPEPPEQPPVEDPLVEDPPQDPPPADPTPDDPQQPPQLPDEPVIADVPDPPKPTVPDDGGTRVRPEDKQPPPRPEVNLAALKRLVAGIHSTDTPLAQRPSLIRSLGDPRFDHPLAYQTLSAILSGQLDRRLPIGQVGGVEVGPRDWRAAARIACAKLDTELAVGVLLETLRDTEAPGAEAALAAMRAPESVAALGDALGGRVTQAQAEAALRALAAIGDPEGYAAVLTVFTKGSLPGGLVREAALAVGALGDPSSLRPLSEGLGDKRRVVRAGSASALGRLGARLPEVADASVDALSNAMRDKELTVCSAAAQALATVGKPGVPTLIACLDPKQEPRSAVRDVVREQLWLLSGEPLADAALAAEWFKKLDPAAPLAKPTSVLTVGGDGPLGMASWGERVVFMLDTSGSMEGDKWTRAQDEVERAIVAYAKRRTSKDRGWINLLAFADAPRFLRSSFVSVTSRSARANLIKLMRRMKPVEVAQTDLLKALQALGKLPKVDTVVLISDAGQEPHKLAEAFSYLRRAAQGRPLKVHTVWLPTGRGPLVVDRGPGHVDDPQGATFMRRLAHETGGLFVRER